VPAQSALDALNLVSISLIAETKTFMARNQTFDRRSSRFFHGSQSIFRHRSSTFWGAVDGKRHFWHTLRPEDIYEYFMVSLFRLYGASSAIDSKDTNKERNGQQLETSNRLESENHDNPGA